MLPDEEEREIIGDLNQRVNDLDVRVNYYIDKEEKNRKRKRSLKKSIEHLQSEVERLHMILSNCIIPKEVKTMYGPLYPSMLENPEDETCSSRNVIDQESSGEVSPPHHP